MSEVDELTPAAGRSALVLSYLLPAAATLAAIAFLIFSAASSERIKAYMDALGFDGDAVQRTLAPTHVWIYLLPIIFVYAAARSIAAVAWIGARLLHAGPSIASSTAATLALAVCLHSTTGPARYNEWNNNYEIYANTDLDEVAGYLKTSLASSDPLVAGGLLDFPLEYHLRILDVPIASLRRPPPHPARVIVLANDSVNQPVARVLKINGYDPARTNVRLVRRFTYSSLYELEPPHAEP
jgi:hypothetical protein